MAESEKSAVVMKVLLAQFRKPPFEPRFLDRIGKTFSKHGFQVISAGARVEGNPQTSSSQIRQLPIFSSGNAGFGSSFRNLLRLINLLETEKPDLFIFCSPEIALLLPYLRLRMPETKVVFDLQENHSLNIRKQKFGRQRKFLSGLLADFLVRLGIQFSQRIWLAESVYQKQISIPASKCIILENKPAPFQSSPPAGTRQPFTFCFTGFVSRESGILTAIHFTELLRKQVPECRLLVCGYCPDKTLRDEISRFPFVEYKQPVDWADTEEIARCLLTSSGMMMSYYETEANEGKCPSKWYLALATGTPVIFFEKTNLHLPGRVDMGFPVDFSAPPADFARGWLSFLQRFKAPAEGDYFFEETLVRDEILRLFFQEASGKPEISAASAS